MSRRKQLKESMKARAKYLNIRNAQRYLKSLIRNYRESKLKLAFEKAQADESIGCDLSDLRNAYEEYNFCEKILAHTFKKRHFGRHY